MDIIFREIREFGESLILLDQHPSKISLYALGNTYCTVCMNLKHKTDINAMAQCMLLDKEKDILGSLDVGQAVVKLQGRIAKPFQIEVPEFVIHKGKISDNFIKQHMQHIAPMLPEQNFPTLSTAGNFKAVKTPDTEIAFLKDVQEYPASGIAARYKRLDLSVRQGQKLKKNLLEKTLIEEKQETTKTGRLTVIRLTEKGNARLRYHGIDKPEKGFGTKR
jgi:hypothetical protein